MTLSAQDKLRIAQALDEVGIDFIEGGWPGSNPKDRAFFKEARNLHLKHAQLCAFGSTRRPQFTPEEDPNLQALLEADTPAISIFGKSWLLHVHRALRITAAENLSLIRSSVAYLKSHGKYVIYDAEHFFDGYQDNPEYALSTLKAAEEAGADVLVLCDTNGGMLPDEVYSIVSAVQRHVQTPLGIHAHNDTGCAVANSIMAVLAGARHVQGTINGIGERCGNADLCTIIPNLQLKRGFALVRPEQLQKLTELSRLVDELAKLHPIDRAPYVGRSAFAHKGGIHVSAILKAPQTYEHIPPETVGNQRRVLISDLSGQSNISYRLQELNQRITDREKLRAIVEHIKALEHKGYEFEAADASVELIIQDFLGNKADFFTRERCCVSSTLAPTAYSEATLVVRIGNHRELAAAEGKGPVDALSQALRRALLPFYPGLENVRLTDYKVRVVHPAEGTRAPVRVLIEHSNGSQRWTTVGVSNNILEASWEALADGMRYALLITKATPPIPTLTSTTSS